MLAQIERFFSTIFDFLGFDGQPGIQGDRSERAELFSRDELERGPSRPTAPDRQAPARAQEAAFGPRTHPSAGVQRNGGGLLARLLGGGSAGASQSWARAESELLSELGNRVTPGEIYVVQLDRAQERATPSLDGRTYVFQARSNGSLAQLGEFRSSSQPTSAERHHPDARADGVPHITPGLRRVNATLHNAHSGLFSEGGGYFDLGIVNVIRDSDDSGSLSEGDVLRTADGIYFHDDRYGSVGCQRIDDFERFAELIQRGGRQFTYLLVRGGDRLRDPRRIRTA